MKTCHEQISVLPVNKGQIMSECIKPLSDMILFEFFWRFTRIYNDLQQMITKFVFVLIFISVQNNFMIATNRNGEKTDLKKNNLYLNFQVAQVGVVEDFSVDLDRRQVLLTPVKTLLVEAPKLHQLLELQG